MMYMKCPVVSCPCKWVLLGNAWVRYWPLHRCCWGRIIFRKPGTINVLEDFHKIKPFVNKRFDTGSVE